MLLLLILSFVATTWAARCVSVISQNAAEPKFGGLEAKLLEEIYGHMKDIKAIPISRGYTHKNNGEGRRKITTAKYDGRKAPPMNFP